MPRFVRSSLVAGLAAAVVAAGVITVAPQAVASAPRSATASVTLAADFVPVGCSSYNCWSVPLVVDSTTSMVYAPGGQDGELESVSHPLGLIQQLGVQPPIYKAIIGPKTGNFMQVAPQIVTDVAAFGGYTNAAAAVVGQRATLALGDTFTPAKWGDGNVRQEWRDVGVAFQAMTIGIGATVDGAWVPSLRVAAFSIRNQIANDIAGRTPTSIGALPNYAAYYTPVGCSGNKNGGCAVLPTYTTVGCGCGPCLACEVEEPAAAKPAMAKTAGSAVRVTAKAAATPKAAAARTRSAR